MPDIAVYLDIDGHPQPLGLLRLQTRKGSETGVFEYDAGWLRNPNRFSIEPALALTAGIFPGSKHRTIPGSIGDSAPDTWGRRLMLRAERRRAELEHRTPRTLFESAYLLGVADRTRMGALRFCLAGTNDFLASLPDGVPSLVQLGDLLVASERILRDEETDEDFRLLFAPGSSLGGARPKASVIDQFGKLAIASSPKRTMSTVSRHGRR